MTTKGQPGGPLLADEPEPITTPDSAPPVVPDMASFESGFLMQKAAEMSLTVFELLAVRLRQAAFTLSRADNYVSALEDARALVKAQAIGRLMLTENPNGKDGKLHSATSAEAVVETDDGYFEHRERQRGAAEKADLARAEYEVAKSRMRYVARGN